MVTAIGYVRVSTSEQADSGYSVAMQQAKIKAYAELYDISLTEIIVDAGASAKTLNRDGLQSVLTKLDNREVDAVVIFKLDRLTRNVSDWNYLIEKYFSTGFLFSVSDQIDTRTAAGRLCLNVLMSVAQWERETISERTKAALGEKKSQGEHIGSVPYGYEIIDKKLTQIANESEVITAIIQMSDSGMKQQQIADNLNARGLPTKRGKLWQPSQICRILQKVKQQEKVSA